MQNVLIKFPNNALNQIRNSASVISTSEVLRQSAAAMRQETQYSDAGSKFLTLGLVVIAHIVFISTFANYQSSQAVDLRDPIPISVALIASEPNVTKLAPVTNSKQAKPIVKTVAKQLPSPTSPVVPTPLEKSISELSTSSKPIAEPSEPAKTEKVVQNIAEASSAGASSTDKPATEIPVVAPKFNADYLHNPAPEYPRASLRRGEQGKVMLKVLVNPEGLPERVVVEQSSGFEALDKSALQAVKNWKFIPASSNNRPISGSVIVPIRFNLDS